MRPVLSGVQHKPSGVVRSMLLEGSELPKSSVRQIELGKKFPAQSAIRDFNHCQWWRRFIWVVDQSVILLDVDTMKVHVWNVAVLPSTDTPIFSYIGGNKYEWIIAWESESIQYCIHGGPDWVGTRVLLTQLLMEKLPDFARRWRTFFNVLRIKEQCSTFQVDSPTNLARDALPVEKHPHLGTSISLGFFQSEKIKRWEWVVRNDGKWIMAVVASASLWPPPFAWTRLGGWAVGSHVFWGERNKRSYAPTPIPTYGMEDWQGRLWNLDHINGLLLARTMLTSSFFRGWKVFDSWGGDSMSDTG